jgi:hypothetical protein
MARATQLLAYHGRTALLLGPMPRRMNMVPANQSGPLRAQSKSPSPFHNAELRPATISTSLLLSMLFDDQTSPAQRIDQPKKTAAKLPGKSATLVDLSQRKLNGRVQG